MTKKKLVQVFGVEKASQIWSLLQDRISPESFKSVMQWGSHNEMKGVCYMYWKLHQAIEHARRDAQAAQTEWYKVWSVDVDAAEYLECVWEACSIHAFNLARGIESCEL